MKTDNPYKCDLLKEDYIECLHHRKEVLISFFAISPRKIVPIWWMLLSRRRRVKRLRRPMPNGLLRFPRSIKVTDNILNVLVFLVDITTIGSRSFLFGGTVGEKMDLLLKSSQTLFMNSSFYMSRNDG